MSYISDWKHSKQTEDDYMNYRSAAAEDNARGRWEEQQELDRFYDWDDDEDDYEDEE